MGAVASSAPTFSWKAADNAKGYELALDRVGEDGKQIKWHRSQGPIRANRYSFQKNLPSGQYMWWVRAVGEQSKGEWVFAGFEVAKPEVPTAPLPEDPELIASLPEDPMGGGGGSLPPSRSSTYHYPFFEPRSSTYLYHFPC